MEAVVATLQVDDGNDGVACSTVCSAVYSTIDRTTLRNEIAP